MISIKYGADVCHSDYEPNLHVDLRVKKFFRSQSIELTMRPIGRAMTSEVPSLGD